MPPPLSHAARTRSAFFTLGLQVLSVFAEVEAFEKLSTAVATVVEAQVDMPLVSAVSLHVALLSFVLRCHADRLDYVDSVLVRASLWFPAYIRLSAALEYGSPVSTTFTSTLLDIHPLSSSTSKTICRAFYHLFSCALTSKTTVEPTTI